MVPIVCCQEHDASKRVLFDMCETDETGEVMPPSTFFFSPALTSLLFFFALFLSIPASARCLVLQSALQAYCRTYKRAPVSQAHALLRKARRLDALLHPHRTDVFTDSPTEPDHQCDVCTTRYSPCFYRSRYYIDRWYCHKCHWSLQVKASGEGAAEEWSELMSPRASRTMQE